MRTIFLSAVLFVLMFTAGCVQNEGTPQNTTSGNDVNIINFAYEPSDITVSVGDTVIWTNMDSVSHTVTSDEGGELDSPLLSQGDTYSHTFESAGVYDYHCTVHPFMKGIVTVE